MEVLRRVRCAPVAIEFHLARCPRLLAFSISKLILLLPLSLTLSLLLTFSWHFTSRKRSRRGYKKVEVAGCTTTTIIRHTYIIMIHHANAKNSIEFYDRNQTGWAASDVAGDPHPRPLKKIRRERAKKTLLIIIKRWRVKRSAHTRRAVIISPRRAYARRRTKKFVGIWRLYLTMVSIWPGSRRGVGGKNKKKSCVSCHWRKGNQERERARVKRIQIGAPWSRNPRRHTTRT